MLRQKIQKARSFLFVLSCVFLSITISFPTAALSKSKIHQFGSNNILFYDPDEDEVRCRSTSTLSSSSSSSSGNERLKEVVREYGEAAMDLQRKYGSPWEVIFAQMLHESGVGTAGVASSVAEQGYYNWLGITGTGDAGTYVSSSGRKWAMFSSIETMMDAWAGTYVLRNGYYDDAFAYLDPDNYDLTSFLRVMISHYAPSSDGNDEDAYVNAILTAISSPINEVREEKGWPSSEELAKQENIGIGGEYSLGSESSSTTTYTSGTLNNSCASSSSLGSGSLAEIAVWMSWEDDNHHSEVKAEYQEAMESVMGTSQSLSYYQDCGHFVATVVRYSGLDDDFPLSGTGTMLSYLSGSNLWEEIPNLSNTSNLQPGDILVVHSGGAHHIMMYVGDYGGGKNLASASQGDRTANLGNIYFSQKNQPFHIFRYAGSSANATQVNNEEGEE